MPGGLSANDFSLLIDKKLSSTSHKKQRERKRKRKHRIQVQRRVSEIKPRNINEYAEIGNDEAVNVELDLELQFQKAQQEAEVFIHTYIYIYNSDMSTLSKH